jgi:hypothetical protein
MLKVNILFCFHTHMNRKTFPFFSYYIIYLCYAYLYTVFKILFHIFQNASLFTRLSLKSQPPQFCIKDCEDIRYGRLCRPFVRRTNLTTTYNMSEVSKVQFMAFLSPILYSTTYVPGGVRDRKKNSTAPFLSWMS